MDDKIVSTIKISPHNFLSIQYVVASVLYSSTTSILYWWWMMCWILTFS